jgi:pre-mRNA-processing factor 17
MPVCLFVHVCVCVCGCCAGHLLLSAGLEGKCKIWDVFGDRNCKRTYIGHEEGVKAIHFSNDGSEFLSSGYDRYIRLWDVETGQARGTFSNRKMGYDVKFYPNDNNVFLVAASDNKIYQWDVRTGGVCQEYNYHLQPCNTINFFDNGRKFVSTSDDKKILVCTCVCVCVLF